MVAAGLADEVLVQIAYAIGVAEPVGVFINTYGTAKVKLSDGEIAQKISKIFDLRPSAIIRRLGLKNPIFRATSAYGHMGRVYTTNEVSFNQNGDSFKKEIEFFTWEKLDYLDIIKKEFNI